MGFISRVTTAGLLALAAGGSDHLLHNGNFANKQTSLANPSRQSASIECEYSSPADNLERIEMEDLRAAAPRLRGLRVHLSVAMYAFTDRAIAQVLIEEASAGALVPHLSRWRAVRSRGTRWRGLSRQDNNVRFTTDRQEV